MLFTRVRLLGRPSTDFSLSGQCLDLYIQVQDGISITSKTTDQWMGFHVSVNVLNFDMSRSSTGLVLTHNARIDFICPNISSCLEYTMSELEQGFKKFSTKATMRLTICSTSIIPRGALLPDYPTGFGVCYLNLKIMKELRIVGSVP